MSDFTPINNIKEEDGGDASEAPETPSKRKNGAQGGTGTPKKAKSENNAPMSGVKNKASKIPETFDELAEEDKMLMEWKERGESYVTINAEWERITGKKVGKSTLSVRYPRIKASLACVASEDVAQMVTSKTKIEEMIQAEIKELHNKMWARVGKDMEEAGTQTYPVSFQHSI
jgi:hypothetical protein